MVSTFPHQPQLTPLKRFSGIKFLSSSLLLAVSASVTFSTSASAIETITLVFNESRVAVPFSDFQNFVKTGETQRTNLQEFFAKIPSVSQATRTVLTREVAITRPFSERNFNNPITDFLLLQLNNVLTSSTVPDNLEPLRTALVASHKDDQRISMLEVIGNYPANELWCSFPV